MRLNVSQRWDADLRRSAQMQAAVCDDQVHKDTSIDVISDLRHDDEGTPPPLTHGNHFRTGFGPGFSHFRRYAGQPWHVDVAGCSRPAKSFHKECIEAARLIGEDYSGIGDVRPMVSGGIDSEFMLRCFARAGVPVRPVLFDINGANGYDSHHAVTVCEELGIELEVMDFDYSAFLEDRVYEYAADMQCPSPHTCAHAAMSDMVRGVPVIAMGDGHMQKEKGTWVWYQWERTSGALYRHFSRSSWGVPTFFNYTPELMFSWLESVHAMVSFSDSTLDAKHTLYQMSEPHVVRRNKYNGFEAMWEQELPVRKRLGELYGGWDDTFTLTYDEIYRRLRP